MWELRWILLGLGILLIAGVYIWSRKPFSISFRSTSDELERTEPTVSDIVATDFSDTELPSEDAATFQPRLQRQRADKVVIVRLITREQADLSCEQAVDALGAMGLVHGKYGIFHFFSGDGSDEPLFSVANLTEPGSFDITDLNDTTIPGMSFFIALPGPGYPVVCFDAMILAARTLTQKLNAELVDERGSSWSIQRERYIPEEVIEYRHQLTRA